MEHFKQQVISHVGISTIYSNRRLSVTLRNLGKAPWSLKFTRSLPLHAPGLDKGLLAQNVVIQVTMKVIHPGTSASPILITAPTAHDRNMLLGQNAWMLLFHPLPHPSTDKHETRNILSISSCLLYPCPCCCLSPSFLHLISVC